MLSPNQNWVYVAAALQLTQLPAMFFLRKLHLGAALGQLDSLSRAYVGALSTGSVWYVSGMALVLAFEPDALLRTRLGIALCALHAFAWTTRCLQHWLRVGQTWPLHHGRWLYWTTGLIYSALSVLFTCFLLSY